jgi:hypothetical protein
LRSLPIIGPILSSPQIAPVSDFIMLISKKFFFF